MHLGEHAIPVGLLELGQDVALPRDRVLDTRRAGNGGSGGADESARADLRADQAALGELTVGPSRGQVVDAGELGELTGRRKLRARTQLARRDRLLEDLDHGLRHA